MAKSGWGGKREGSGRRVKYGTGTVPISLRVPDQLLAEIDHDRGDGAERHALDFFRLGLMAIGALVLGPEGFLQMGDHGGVEGAVGDGHGQLEGLALIVHVGGADDSGAIGWKAVGRELGAVTFA